MPIFRTTFHPHIPPTFTKSPLGKLLILGDSHYEANPPINPQNYTKDIIADDAAMSKNFFRNVARLFGRNSFKELRTEVAFANAIQEFMPNATAKPSSAQIAASEDAIRNYLDATDADRAVMFSSRIWEGLFNKPKDWGKYVETIEIGGKKATVWQWTKRNGKQCYGIGLHHPSTIGWKSEEWKPILDAFLKKY